MTRTEILALASQCGIPSVVTDIAPEKFEAFFHAAQREALTQPASPPNLHQG
jgi:hypothetical protein